MEITSFLIHNNHNLIYPTSISAKIKEDHSSKSIKKNNPKSEIDYFYSLRKFKNTLPTSTSINSKEDHNPYYTDKKMLAPKEISSDSIPNQYNLT